MYKHTIRISIDVRREFDKDINKFLDLRKQVWNEFSPALAGLGKASALGGHGDEFPLTQQNCAALAALLPTLRAHKYAHLSGAQWRTSLAQEAAERTEWFIVWPATWTDIDGSTDQLIDVRADRMKGREPMRRYSEDPLVSEQWVSFVREHGFTGIDFLWCRDKGKYAAMQWYIPVGTTFLGRGVDHLWFDPNTRGTWNWEGFMITQPTDRAWMIGVRIFDATQTRNDLRTEPPALASLLDELRRTPTRYSAAIFAPQCVLREFLPETDFAYLRIAQPHEPGDRRFRTVRLCCNAAARRKLLDAKMAKPADFEPIEVLDAPPPGVPVFDSKEGPVPPPAFPPDEWAKAKKAEAKYRARFDANPKPPMPVKPPEIKKLIPKLKRRLKKQESPIAKGAKPDAVAATGEKIGIIIPARWAELLAAVDGFMIDNCYALDGTAELRVAAAKDLPGEHESNRGMIESGDLELPKTHLGVASSDIGDCIFLDTAQLTPEGDCPVLFVNHETLETDASWPAIGIFLSDALESSEE